MQYPVHILPKPKDRLLADAAAVGDRYLLRAIYGPLDRVYDPITTRFRAHLFPSRETLHLRDLSTCLYGTFRPDDFSYYILGAHKAFWIEDWSVGEAVPLIPIEAVGRKPTTDCAYLRVEQVHERTFTIDNRPDIGPITIRVGHTPTRCNLHHFSIRCYREGVNLIEQYVARNVKKLKKSAEERAILSFFRTELREQFRLGVPTEIPMLPEPYVA